MINCIAIDDEPLSLELIKTFSKQIAGLQLLATFTDINKAIAFLEDHPVQMLFLDIQMPDMNGLDFYRQYGKNKMVVFTTAFSEYAFEGFNVSAVDFLVKPFDLQRFSVACEKAKTYLKLNTSGNQPEQEFIAIRSDYKYTFVNLADIIYIESRDDYVKFIMPNKKSILSKITTKSVQDQLPPSSFIRIHRSYIVNIKYLKSLNAAEMVVGDVVLPIGKKYKEEVMTFVQHLG